MNEGNCPSLPAHYERHLGVIARGWVDKERSHDIQIVSFNAQPEPGVTTFATLGLSNHTLSQPSGRQARQELLTSANVIHDEAAVAGLLLSLAERVLAQGQLLLRGEVIGPASPVINGSPLTAVYVTNPSPFEGLANFDCGLPPVIFAYLVPIAESEATLVHERGWRWFEEQLEEQNPDIWNLQRSERVQTKKK